MPNDKYRILSTKPLTQEQLQLAAAHELAVDVQVFIHIKPIWNKDVKPAFAKGGVFVFSSPNAVKSVVEQLGNALPAGRAYCIQGATKQAVEEHLIGFTITGTAANSKELAELMLKDGGFDEVTFCCGNIRRDELPEMLRANDVVVHELIVYETNETPKTMSGVYDGIMFFSPSSVRSFFTGNTLHANTTCFAIGHTTGAVLQERTQNKVVISPEAAVDALLQTVILHFDNIK